MGDREKFGDFEPLAEKEKKISGKPNSISLCKAYMCDFVCHSFQYFFQSLHFLSNALSSGGRLLSTINYKVSSITRIFELLMVNYFPHSSKVFL